jgi:hypothetical protein
MIVDRRFGGAYCLHHPILEAVRTSETSVDNHLTRQYNPEDSTEHHTRRREILNSHIKFLLNYYNAHIESARACCRIFCTSLSKMHCSWSWTFLMICDFKCENITIIFICELWTSKVCMCVFGQPLYKIRFLHGNSSPKLTQQYQFSSFLQSLDAVRTNFSWRLVDKFS